MATVREYPGVPRATGNQAQDQIALTIWANDFFRSTKVRFDNIEGRVDAAAALTALETTATLAEVITKVNAIIAALQES